MTEILIILFLILLNGVFAMAEISMVSSRKSRLESAAKKGDAAAKKALALSQNPGKFLSTVQIGITLIGILTGIYSGQKIESDLQLYLNGFEVLKPYSASLSIAIIVVVLTFFSLVLGELVPKRIGLINPESIAKTLAYPMYIISIIAAPFIWLLTFSSDLILRTFNIKKSSDSHLSEEEIKAIIMEGTETGVVQEIEQDIVDNVFHLGDRRIKTLMTLRPDIHWLDVNDTFVEIKEKIADSLHKSFIVCKDNIDNVIGILDSKDLLNATLRNEPFQIEKRVKPAQFFPENTKAFKALSLLRKSKQHIALVVDEYGSVQGVLTMNDLMEVLVGDLTQQLHDSHEIVPRNDGSFLIDTSLPLPEFNRYFDVEIENDLLLANLNTVGGLVYHLSNNIPTAGYKFQWKNFAFEIVDMDGRRIDKVIVKKLEK
ncbi:MAG: HlyC/CorC family transporter [Bacteroidetes bacterium]|nr:HlyC/CorC family transporter [Bacteroidota bacterium]